MIKPYDLATALRRLSTSQISGTKEATAFFAIAMNLSTSEDVANFTGERGTTRSRLSMLSFKGLIKSKKTKGKYVYTLTEKGKKLYNSILQ